MSRRVVLATALASLAALCSAAAGAAPPGSDAVTERVREIIRKDEGDSDSRWGADPPAEEIAERGEPFAATILSGSGHAMVVIGKDGQPADLARLETYLTPKGKGPSDLRTRTYALEALARRTGRDTRCDGNRRLTDAAAAAAWKR